MFLCSQRSLNKQKKFLELVLAEYSDLDRGSTHTHLLTLSGSMLSHVKANLLTHLSTLTSSPPSLNKNVPWPPPAAVGITIVAGGLDVSIQWTVNKCFWGRNEWIYLPFSKDIGDMDKQKTQGQFLNWQTDSNTSYDQDHVHSSPFWNWPARWYGLQTPQILP